MNSSAQHISSWRHDHVFGLDERQSAEKRTILVVAVTTIMMVVELIAGWLTGSMALTADGWHMSTHAAALAITVFAYQFARNNANNRKFTFGTGKVTSLGGFASAVSLVIVAVLMAFESVQRLLDPIPVNFGDAMVVAFVGLLVNLGSAKILGHSHDHGGHHDHDDHDDHDHDDHDHDHDQHDHDDHHAAPHGEHKDHNLRAAYLHVLADALTSVTALVALSCGMYLGWTWLDPVMGIVGSLVILAWSVGLLRDCSEVLLDAEEHGERNRKIQQLLESDGDTQVADLHLWRVGPRSHSCIVSLVNHNELSAAHYKQRLQAIPGLDHVTVEVNQCLRCQE